MYQFISHFVSGNPIGTSFGGLMGILTGVLAQEDAGVPAAPVDPAGGDVPFIVQLVNNPLVPIAGVMLLFYFMLIAPERRRRMEEAKRIAGIKKGDRVVTAGGLHGKVSAARSDSDVVTVQLDDSGDIKVKISRWALTVAGDEKKPEGEQK